MGYAGILSEIFGHIAIKMVACHKSQFTSRLATPLLCGSPETTLHKSSVLGSRSNHHLVMETRFTLRCISRRAHRKVKGERTERALTAGETSPKIHAKSRSVVGVVG